ncbi:Plasmodium variant antigen protein Cir/Yir/Bir, putative [Plasmodium chabaudi adami]|uniref:Plasmodium variant antigen protein Cir/Yir/Bir, putative n=1 Tax=Plasmodium chabaudi adami TaxID=5826 RepID=A0A1D3L7F0_PLACE|nr:Plasmodium variant antigen protein Cir/Yir/Bir, putative [Plasmodium chabaudi adami]
MTINGMCETFLEADKIINGENGARMKMEEIDKNQSYYGFCPNNKCVKDVQCIGAMTMYVFLKVGADKNNEYGEYFLMWLSDKLFKMHEDKKKSQSNITTLDEAYKSYLDKNIGNYKYWDALDNVKGLKNANLSHMNEFYKLLKYICKTIMHHKTKDAEPTNLLQNYTNSSNQYTLLYRNFSKCNSYLHLLDNLKKIYEKFRTTIKNGDPNLPSSLEETGASPSIADNGADTLKCIDKVVDDTQSKENNKGSEQTDGKGGGSDNNQVNQGGSGGTGSGPSAPNEPSNPPNNSHQTSQSSQLPSSTEQKKTDQSSQEPSGSQNSDKNDQGPQKPVESPMVKSENCVIKVKGNETTGIGDIYVPKEYKQVGILIIVILIPITLAIMYKYLSFGRRNELKKKKNMKKVINLMEEKRQMQIIIKSSSQKKQTKKSINPVYGEKSPSTNIYKLMQADPVPFINLIFLLIFLFIKEKTILWKDIFN